VCFLNGQPGVIYVEGKDDPYKVPGLEEMFIDTGATSQEDCPVKVGDVAAFERPFTELGTRLVSKAMDDRISVAVLVETLKQLGDTPHEIYFVFTVQEEVGVRGATTAAYAIDPDIGLAVDVTRTGDTPKGHKMTVRLGDGPAIKIRDAGMLVDPRIVEWMENAAKQARIPHQFEILERGGTDARAIQMTRAGVPAGCLSVPCRYIHSPSEMVDINDVENSVRLMLALLENPIDIQ
jgi:endoglucanase